MKESKYHFEHLAPRDNIELKIYEDALNYVFENPAIKNVAISGAYGAGKSSVLASYKKKHDDLNFIHISLAHFKTPDQVKTEPKESVLEGKILNQLIHQIPSNNIPQTDFKIKKKIDSKNTIKMTVKSVFFFISVLFFICFNSWTSYVANLSNGWFKSVLSISTHQYALVIDGILITILFAHYIYKLITFQKNRNAFRKLNLQGNEIEIFKESDDSFFDKYLNEVLYLFENAEADAIVFEDMDRFDAYRIFERLHEVNTLANIQLQKEKKKSLRFFYLLRDDIFVSKDRTKFFDFIIPVVPVIDSSNSFNEFITYFKDAEWLSKFNRNFLQQLSLYIDDMRLLKNIYNEFVIYFEKLNTTELDCNKMLAIIAYKNLFPRDFADLQINQGFVFTLFKSKDIFITDEVKRLEKQILETQQKIETARQENLKSIHELNSMFTFKYLRNYYNYWLYYDEDALQRFVSERLNNDQMKEYSERKKNLVLDISREEEKVNSIEKELAAIKNKRLCQIITRDNDDQVFSITSTNEIGELTNFNEVKGNEYFDLIKYLIRNGHIDETYADYMTFFYENNLSRVDKIFLRSVTDRKAKDYTYGLKDLELVVSYLKLADFDQEEILNFDLLTYLLRTQAPIEYLERYIDQLKHTKNFKFVSMFIDTTTEFPVFVKYLNMRWPELFSMALNDKTLTEKQMRQYSIYSLYSSDNAILEAINKENCLSDYISNARDYLAIKSPDVDKLIQSFTLLKVCFVGFDYEKINKELFEMVYAKSLYEINSENLQLIEREVLGEKNNDIIFHKNYTLLLSHTDSSIGQYIDQNINKYFDVILPMSDGIILDDQDAVVTMLNNPDITIEHKHSYIDILKTVIVSIKEVADSDLWSLLLNAGVIQYSEQNIMDYFSTAGLDESLISYINKCNIELNFSKIADDDAKEKLADSIVKCNSIQNSKYKQILVSLNIYYVEFDIPDISEGKVRILIDESIIEMTEEILSSMRENYPNLNLYFISKNIEKYAEIMNEGLFSQKELLEILVWDISDEIKTKLLEFSTDEISIIDMNYSTKVNLHILDRNFMDSDLMKLFLSFEQWDDAIQMKIQDLAIADIASVINEPDSVSERLKNRLMESSELSRDSKIDLFVAMLPNLNDARIKKFLELLGLSNYLKIFDVSSRPKFQINNENEKLLTAFKERMLIDNYKEDSVKKGFYRIIRVKSKKKAL